MGERREKQIYVEVALGRSTVQDADPGLYINTVILASVPALYSCIVRKQYMNSSSIFKHMCRGCPSYL